MPRTVIDLTNNDMPQAARMRTPSFQLDFAHTPQLSYDYTYVGTQKLGWQDMHRPPARESQAHLSQMLLRRFSADANQPSEQLRAEEFAKMEAMQEMEEMLLYRQAMEYDAEHYDPDLSYEVSSASSGSPCAWDSIINDDFVGPTRVRTERAMEARRKLGLQYEHRCEAEHPARGQEERASGCNKIFATQAHGASQVSQRRRRTSPEARSRDAWPEILIESSKPRSVELICTLCHHRG
jgi:hypothetical protein